MSVLQQEVQQLQQQLQTAKEEEEASACALDEARDRQALIVAATCEGEREAQALRAAGMLTYAYIC